MIEGAIAMVLLFAMLFFAFSFLDSFQTSEERERYEWNKAMLESWKTKKPKFVSYDMMKGGRQ